MGDPDRSWLSPNRWPTKIFLDPPERFVLNQYQGGMCISWVLTTTERTPRHLISPLGLNWVGTDSAVQRYVHFTLALV